MGETWLRIVTYRIEELAALDYVRGGLQDVLRMLTRRSGFRDGQWGFDTDGRTVAAVTYWADHGSIEAAGEDLVALGLDRAAHGVRLTAAVNMRLFTSPQPWRAEDWAALGTRSESTWLRVVRYRPEPDARSDAPTYLRSTTQTVLRVLRHQPGFRIGYWGHDPTTGTMGAVTYWDSPAAIAAAAPLLDRLHRERRSHGITTEHIANLELFRVPVLAD